MAILITVFQCDNCPTVAGLKTDVEWTDFEKTWWEGFRFQFCPECKEAPQTEARRENDRLLFAASIQKREEKDQNAEFIN